MESPPENSILVEQRSVTFFLLAEGEKTSECPLDGGGEL